MFARLSAWWWQTDESENKNQKEILMPLTEPPPVRKRALEREVTQEEKKEEKNDKHGKSEVKEEAPLELNIYDNLKLSAKKLEQALRAQLKSLLDPEIYENLILNGPREYSGRYSVVTADKKDKVYYYQHALNLLMDFQRMMEPVSVLHWDLTRLFEKQRTWDKAKQLYWDSTHLNQTLNDLGLFYNDFLLSIRELELDTALGGLPSFFSDFKTWLFSVGFVQVSQAHFAKNPFVDTYKQNGEHWRELLGLPPAQAEQSLVEWGWEEDEDLDGHPEHREEKKEEKEEKKEEEPIAALLERKPKVEAKLRQMQVIKDALNKILADLSGSTISESVRKDYEKTIELSMQILRKIDAFSEKEQSWKNFIAFAYGLCPTVKDLLSSLPQSYSALNKILKEHLLTTVRQVNWIIREGFLYLDRLESDFYFKDGLIQHLGEGNRNCGLFFIDQDPNTLAAQEVLNEILSDDQDAYLIFESEFCYINRYKKRQNEEWGIHVKKLKYRQRARAEQKEAESHGSAAMFYQARLDLDISGYGTLSDKGYSCVYQNLTPHHLLLMRSVLTEPSGGKLTGRYRLPGLYQGGQHSLAHFAQEFQAWVNYLGYDFSEAERYPYTQVYLEQRQELLDEEKERIADLPKQDKKNKCKQDFLAKRLKNKTDEWIKEQDLTTVRKQEQIEQLAYYKHRLVKTQIDKRILELQSEITSMRRRLSQVKDRKIRLLKRLWQAFERQPNESCQALIQGLNLTPLELHLLHDGRTGKLIATLRLLTSKPVDRSDLIQIQIERRLEEQKQIRKYGFFAARRQKRLTQSLAALQELKMILKPCDRLYEVLDYLSAKKPEHFAALQYESKLLSDLQGIDGFTPDIGFGLKPLDLANPIFHEFETSRQTEKEARRVKRHEAKHKRETPLSHFFRPQHTLIVEPPQATPAASSIPEAFPQSPSGRIITGLRF